MSDFTLVRGIINGRPKEQNPPDQCVISRGEPFVVVVVVVLGAIFTF